MNAELSVSAKKMFDKSFEALKDDQQRLVTGLLEIISNADLTKTAMKKKILAMLGAEFPPEDWSVPVVTNVLVVIITRIPMLITDVITKNWIKRAHKNTCLHAMALEHEVFNAYDHILTQIDEGDFLDADLMTKFIKNHPALFACKNMRVNRIPHAGRAHIMEAMGTYMCPLLWGFGKELMLGRTETQDCALFFFRRAVQAIRPSEIISFISLLSPSPAGAYNLVSEEMIHYMAPKLCEYFVTLYDKPKAEESLQKVWYIRSHPVIITELFALFIQRYPVWGMETRARATKMIFCLDFGKLQKQFEDSEKLLPPAPLRIIAKEVPAIIMRVSRLFSRDEEVIRSLLGQDNVHAMNRDVVDNIDHDFLLMILPRCLREVEGAWGVLMYLVDNHYGNLEAQAYQVRERLLSFMLSEQVRYSLFKHRDGCYYIHLPDDKKFMIANASCPAQHVVLVGHNPVHIHPMDLYVSFPFAEYDMASMLARRARDFMYTPCHEGPLMRRFFEMRPKYSEALNFQLWNTGRMLAEIFENNTLGIEVRMMDDPREQSGLEYVCFNNNPLRPVVLLHASEQGVDWKGVYELIGLKLGISLLSIITNKRLIYIRTDNGTWTWMGFMMQPAFKWMFPTFEQTGLHFDPKKIVQISRYVQDLDTMQLGSRFSPWILYDINNHANNGPRLMNIVNPPQEVSLQNLFARECVLSGNQMLSAWQEMGNVRGVLDDVLRGELKMEIRKVRVLIESKFISNTLAFEQKKVWFDSFANPTPDDIKQTKEQREEAKNKLKWAPCPILIANSPKKRKGQEGEWLFPKWSSDRVKMRIATLPNEVLVIVYKHLVQGMLDEVQLPGVREILPDAWWNGTKQNLMYGTNDNESYLYVETPIVGLTDKKGVLHGEYCKEVIWFFKEDIWSNLMANRPPPNGIWSTKFSEWPNRFLKYIPDSKRIPLFGGLFVVQFEFKKADGYCMTIEPNRMAFRIHDLFRDGQTDQFAMLIESDVEPLKWNQYAGSD